MDEELRALERAAARGDREARQRLVAARRRSGWRPPADITLRWPFPVRLPFPRIHGELGVPNDVLFLDDRVVLTVRGRELELPWLSNVNDPGKVRLHAGESAYRIAPPAPCGAGLRVSVVVPDGRLIAHENVHYLVSPGGLRGALLLPNDRLARFDPEQLDVGAPGAWSDDPGVAGGGPWTAGSPGWALQLHSDPYSACRALRELLGLELPRVAALKPRLDGPIFVGFREDLERAAARFRETGIEAEALWFDALPDGLEPLPEAP